MPQAIVIVAALGAQCRGLALAAAWEPAGGQEAGSQRWIPAEALLCVSVCIACMHVCVCVCV